MKSQLFSTIQPTRVFHINSETLQQQFIQDNIHQDDDTQPTYQITPGKVVIFTY